MFISFLRSVTLYIVLILVIRLMGKRQIGELEPSEFVVSMLIADLASVPMQDNGIPLLSGLVPILTVLALELLMAVASLRSIKLRRFLCGKPVILMENGRIQQSNLRRTRITIDELVGHLRQSGITDLEQVQFAILETDGQLSVLPYPQYQPAPARDAGLSPSPLQLPVTIISDGRVLQDNLALLGRSRRWLQKQLENHNCTPDQVFYMTAEPSGRVYLALQEERS